MTNGNFGCGSEMTERALTRSILMETATLGTTVCVACVNAPS